MSEWLQAITRLAEGRASRSTVLQPLIVMIGIFVLALATATAAKAPEGLLILFGSILAVLVLVAVVAYIIFGYTNPDLLRTEKFLIRKMEIEQSSIGDSVRGIQPLNAPELRQLPQQTTGGVS